MASRKQKIKRKDKHGVPEKNRDSIKEIGQNCESSTIATVATAGTTAAAKAVNLGSAITDKNNKQSAAKAAVKRVATDNGVAVDNFNSLATIVEQQIPDNPTAWVEFGFEVTTDESHDAVNPPQVVHGSMSQGDNGGDVDLHWDALKIENVDFFVLVTKGSPTDRNSYIDVTNLEGSTTASSTTITLPTAYLNVPLFFIVFAHNTAGKGTESTPFGGRPIF